MAWPTYFGFSTKLAARFNALAVAFFPFLEGAVFDLVLDRAPEAEEVEEPVVVGPFSPLGIKDTSLAFLDRRSRFSLFSRFSTRRLELLLLLLLLLLRTSVSSPSSPDSVLDRCCNRSWAMLMLDPPISLNNRFMEASNSCTLA
jgi:hypothetical protein